MVSDYFLPRLGGIELHMRDLSRRLIAEGCEVEIHTTIPGPDIVDGIAVHRTPALLVPRFGFAVSPGLVGLIGRELARGRYDVLHAHLSIVSPLSCAAIVAARQLQLPVVATFHSVMGRAGWGLKAIGALAGWSRRPIAFTGVSELVAGELRAALPQADVSVLSNGVDLGYWSATRVRKPRDGVLAVSAMRLAPRKRPMALLKAFRTAQQQVRARDVRLQLAIAGEGSERPRMEKFIADGGLLDVDLLGVQTRDSLRDLYGEADVFVLPSVQEAFGIAALEAHCAGLPVIAMREAAPCEFLSHGHTALLAADDAGLAAAIARFAGDEQLRAHLVAPAPTAARFSWPAVVAAHQACYARIRARQLAQ